MPSPTRPGDLFKTVHDAAKYFGRTYNLTSIAKNKELSSYIYSVKKKGETLYSYTKAKEVDGNNVKNTPWYYQTPRGASLEGDAHTHGAYDPNYLNNQFSPDDMIGTDNSDFKVAFVVTPNGTLLKYTPAESREHDEGRIEVVNTDMPSDPKDPTSKKTVPQEPPDASTDSSKTPHPTQSKPPEGIRRKLD
ncbi:uncharacterized protein DUF4329 [Chitinophaga skermanii]|uniref:Uncharacterized protein DUF4329 n=1 Tax=Chitinophaga skermanii TaxID=331697 RepID=A0A327QA76_9BACT|nr:DUF4329 domain-containing protein [Chitinophaga skermanii]RAJ00512.1 uncharacterized protein DUF4329 [Chitinophaga skermanii]